jgi:hypothetical protein
MLGQEDAMCAHARPQACASVSPLVGGGASLPLPLGSVPNGSNGRPAVPPWPEQPAAPSRDATNPKTTPGRCLMMAP